MIVHLQQHNHQKKKKKNSSVIMQFSNMPMKPIQYIQHN